MEALSTSLSPWAIFQQLLCCSSWPWPANNTWLETKTINELTMGKYLPLPFHVFLYSLICNTVASVGFQKIHSKVCHLLHFHFKERAKSPFLRDRFIIKVMHKKMKENIEENDRNVGWKGGHPVEHSSQTGTVTVPSLGLSPSLSHHHTVTPSQLHWDCHHHCHRSGQPGLCLLESGELPRMEFALPLRVTPSSPALPSRQGTLSSRML